MFLNILSHHKIPVPIGLDAKVFLIQHWILKPIHSVSDNIWRKSFEVYDTDNSVGEVWQLNFYYGIEISHMTRHASKPNKLRNVKPVRSRTGNDTIQKWKIYYIKTKSSR